MPARIIRAVIIAALDLSLRSTGYAVLLGSGQVASYGHTPLRTAEQVANLILGIAVYSPDVVAIESTFKRMPCVWARTCGAPATPTKTLPRNHNG